MFSLALARKNTMRSSGLIARSAVQPAKKTRRSSSALSRHHVSYDCRSSPSWKLFCPGRTRPFLSAMRSNVFRFTSICQSMGYGMRCVNSQKFHSKALTGMRGSRYFLRMPRRTSIPCETEQAEPIRSLAREHRFSQGVVAKVAGELLLELDPERRESLLKRAANRAPSTGDTAQSADSATAKQPRSTRIPSQRRKAG